MIADDIAGVLEQIERRDGAIGAFTDVTAQRALADGAVADEERRRGLDRGRLHGVPIGVKQLFDVAGADQSYGSDVRDGARAAADSAIVRRLRRAGAIVVGTTRSHEFGWGITTQHATRGSTVNPHDPQRTPGGSSGGSAAAVAAGLVPLAVGSDTGGSIRIPAAFCGVLGLKTTWGRISRAGGVALAPSFDSPGFLAASVALLDAALAATGGADALDPATVGTPPVTPPLAVAEVARLRYTVADTLTGPLSPARQAALDRVVEALGELGASRLDVPIAAGERWLQAFVPLQMAEARHVHERRLGSYPAQADRYGADVRSRLVAAGDVGIGDYLDARGLAAELTSSVDRALDTVDLIVSPVGNCAPSRVDDPDHVDVGGERVPLRAAVMSATVAQNIAGLPSITVPVGVDESSLPIGIQITGARWAESTLLGVGRALELAGVVSVTVVADVSREPPSTEGT